MKVINLLEFKNMKNILAIFIFMSILFTGCQDDKVIAPNAEYNIQSLDVVKNVYVQLDKPYVLKVNTDYRVISLNSNEYNSFYLGDSVRLNGKWVFHIYSPKPKSNHQGMALEYNLDLKKSIAVFKYSLVGKYKVTFISAAVGNDGNVVEFNVNDKDSITVVR